MWEDRLSDVFTAIECQVMFVLARGAAFEGDERARSFVAAKEAAVAELQSANQRVRVEWIESVHDVPLAKPEELARLIADFAAGL
jgi:hypothetical protein